MLKRAFDECVERDPAAIALVDGEARLTYASLARRIDGLARHLATAAGVRSGDRVGVFLPNRWEAVAAFFATAMLGAVTVPFPVQWRSREIGWLARRLPLRALLAESSALAAWREADVVPPSVIAVDAAPLADVGSGSVRREPAAADALHACFTTSGSTGRPRIVPRSAANLLAAARDAARRLRVGPGTRVLSVMPFHHVGGFDNCLLVPLLHGATAVVVTAFTVPAVAEAVARERVDLLPGSPFVFSMLADSAVPREAFAGVAAAISFGAPMPAGLAERCAERLGLDVRSLYGASEAGVIAIAREAGKRTPGATGYPVDSVEIRIADAAGAPLPTGSLGEVLVRGPGVIAGYVGEPDLNAEVFRDGFFRTGDLGRIEPSGELSLTGRLKSIINLGGVKVDPAEIEGVLRELPGVRDCRVRGVPDARQGEIVAVSIAFERGSALTRAAVVAHCRARLAEFKIPRRIELTDALAVTVTGKQPAAWVSAEAPPNPAPDR